MGSWTPNERKSTAAALPSAALKPADVRQELEVTDAVLGDPDAVREFVLTAAQRLALSVTPDKRPTSFA